MEDANKDFSGITKIALIEKEIGRLEREIERLRQLRHSVEGLALEVCPVCKTKNLHWNLDDTWTCAYC